MPTLKQLFTENVNGATFISLDTVTQVNLLGGKANPYKGRVTKKMVGANVMVFQNKTTNGYENMVNRRLQAEGKSIVFEVGPRQWGTRVPNTPFVEHKEETYLEVIFLRPGKVEYLLDGQPVDPSTIPGMPAEKEEGEQGGLDNKVVIRTFKFSSIVAVAINGARYEI